MTAIPFIVKSHNAKKLRVTIVTQAKPTKQTQTESIQLEIQFNFTVKISN